MIKILKGGLKWLESGKHCYYTAYSLKYHGIGMHTHRCVCVCVSDLSYSLMMVINMQSTIIGNQCLRSERPQPWGLPEEKTASYFGASVNFTSDQPHSCYSPA